MAAISRVEGRADARYSAHRVRGGFALENGPQRLHARFDSSGVVVRSGADQVALRFDGIGHGSTLRRVLATAPTARANRVEYRHAGATEWYANGPTGLEQGFTIARAPSSATGPLTLQFALPASSHPTLRDGTVRFAGSSLVYRGLVARDANGTPLRSWIELRGHQMQLRVDDAGAAYPVTIDPFIQQATLASPGNQIAVSGDTIAVGGSTETIAGITSTGVDVFVKPAGGWSGLASPVARLTASDGANLGVVAISADTIVAGSLPSAY
ncbi:MAG TPA: hypothetical protein VGF46_11045, partial [Gaiellales bacterium]